MITLRSFELSPGDIVGFVAGGSLAAGGLPPAESIDDIE